MNKKIIYYFIFCISLAIVISQVNAQHFIQKYEADIQKLLISNGFKSLQDLDKDIKTYSKQDDKYKELLSKYKKLNRELISIDTKRTNKLELVNNTSRNYENQALENERDTVAKDNILETTKKSLSKIIREQQTIPDDIDQKEKERSLLIEKQLEELSKEELYFISYVTGNILDNISNDYDPDQIYYNIAYSGVNKMFTDRLTDSKTINYKFFTEKTEVFPSIIYEYFKYIGKSEIYLTGIPILTNSVNSKTSNRKTYHPIRRIEEFNNLDQKRSMTFLTKCSIHTKNNFQKNPLNFIIRDTKVEIVKNIKNRKIFIKEQYHHLKKMYEQSIDLNAHISKVVQGYLLDLQNIDNIIVTKKNQLLRIDAEKIKLDRELLIHKKDLEDLHKNKTKLSGRIKKINKEKKIIKDTEYLIISDKKKKVFKENNLNIFLSNLVKDTIGQKLNSRMNKLEKDSIKIWFYIFSDVSDNNIFMDYEIYYIICAKYTKKKN